MKLTNKQNQTYTMWKPLDDNLDGAMVEIKDRRDGQWVEELFFENNKWHNYLIEITEDVDTGITQSYHTQNQKHALKVYYDIVNKGDYKWGKKRLDKLVLKRGEYWKITASGFVEAESVEEARSILKKDAIGYVMDDEKYLEIDVDPDETNEIKENIESETKNN